MKRIIALACALAILLCACKSKHGEISAGGTGEILSHAADAMLVAGTGGVSAECPTQRQNANGIVALTNAQLKKALDIVKNAEIKPAAMKDVPGSAGELLLHSGENSIRAYLLSDNHEKYPGQTLLWVQISGAASNFICDPDVYTGLNAILESAVTTPAATITGTYMAVELAQGHDIPCGFAEKDGVLVCAYSSYQGTAIVNFIDLQSGQILSTLDINEKIYRLDIGTDGRIRYFTQYAVHYINTKKLCEAADPYILPNALRADSKHGFDIDEKAKKVLYLRNNCIYTAKTNGEDEKLLFTTEDVKGSFTSVMLANLNEGKAELFFKNPRFTENNLACVTTASNWAGMPSLAVSAISIKDDRAQAHHFPEVFGPFGGNVSYEGNVALIQSESKIIFIDLADFVQMQSPIVPHETVMQVPVSLIAEDVWEETPEGLMHNLYLCKRIGMADKRLLLTTIGINLELQGSSAKHIMLKNKNSDELIIIATDMQ